MNKYIIVFGVLAMTGAGVIVSESTSKDLLHTSVFDVTHVSMAAVPCTCGQGGGLSCGNEDCLMKREESPACAAKQEKTKTCGCGRKMGEA